MSEKECNELRVKVAELCGELALSTTKPTIEELEALLNSRENLAVTLLANGEVRALRDYPNDLNACHEFEKIILDKSDGVPKPDLWDKYVQHLGGDWPSSMVTHASAEQRCRAFIATMEKGA